MATTMSSTSTSTSSPQQNQSSANLSALPPIVTEGNSKRPSFQRWSSYSKDRLSTYSNLSVGSQNRSRPGSHVFPVFHSSLSYALVRDFAYPSIHPLHYGPLPPHASGISTPASEYRRLSDPPAPWDSSRGQWSTTPWTTDNSYGTQQLPAMSFGDGPPYSEDEDLHSPVVTAPHHRKNKSTGALLNGRKAKVSDEATDYFGGAGDRGAFVGMNADGSETYYVNDEDAVDDGPGGELVTYPVNESRYSHMPPGSYGHHGDQMDAGFDSDDDIAGVDRYSRDYQFAVGCPDEEMHGKAVALFDFTREHENELPLVEGQVIYVSYRHGQGWLVAEDPKTGESGLVPEEFVRLLRDIEGGLNSLNGDPNSDLSGNTTFLSPESMGSEHTATPTQIEQMPFSTNHQSVNASNGGIPADKFTDTLSSANESSNPAEQATSSLKEGHSEKSGEGNAIDVPTNP